VVKLLLESGAAIDSKDSKSSRTPLSWAAENGHGSVSKLLLEKGAEIDSKDTQYGQTPLSWAAEKGHISVVRLLLDKDADVNVQHELYGNALQAAIYGGHKDILEILIDKHADVNKIDSHGRVALHFALRGNQYAILQYLLKVGIRTDWTRTDRQGCSAFHFAASGGSVEALRFLTKHDTDVSIPDTNGWTPLHWACRNGSVDAFRFLKEAGADLQRKDLQGQTPLDIAVFCDQRPLLSLQSEFNESKEEILVPGIEHNAFCDSCFHVSHLLTPWEAALILLKLRQYMARGTIAKNVSISIFVSGALWMQLLYMTQAIHLKEYYYLKSSVGRVDEFRVDLEQYSRVLIFSASLTSSKE
jgi:ankyrin repeat protein